MGVNSCGAFCSFCGKCGRKIPDWLMVGQPTNVAPPGAKAEGGATATLVDPNDMNPEDFKSQDRGVATIFNMDA